MEPHNSFNLFKHNLILGYRLACGRKLRGQTFLFEPRSLLLLTAFIVGLEGLLQWVAAPVPYEFNIYGVTRITSLYLFDIALLLSLLLFFQYRKGDFSRLITGFISCLPAQIIVSQSYTPILELTGWSPYLEWVYLIVLITWISYIIGRLLLHLFNLPLQRRSALTLYFIASSILIALLIPQQNLWIKKKIRDPRYDAWFSLNPEQVFYAQPGLLDLSLNSIQPHRPGHTDLYLLTFAGYGYEDVFLTEAEYVKNYFDRQYATEKRSLLLANNLKTVNDQPLANYHNLAAALKHISKKIDPDEDIVFLFMTSHGSENFRFSVQFGSIRMNDLSPTDVGRAFDEAGIEWRVIVVSSCYSGGFIEPLKTTRSLIITASSPTTTSFGCGNESSFTWFGTAYFKHALPKTGDFIEAFAAAREWVVAKEKQEGIEPSDPRIYVGEQIREKLDQLRSEHDS